MKKSVICLTLISSFSVTTTFAAEPPKLKALTPKATPAKETPTKIAPLYPVALPFDFPSGKESFEAAKKLILENYYSPTINEQTLYWAAIKGMLRQISPPENREHSKLLQPVQSDAIEKMLSGKSTSLGIATSFNPRDGSLTVTDVVPESPADGVIFLDDRVMQINKVALTGKRSDEVLKLLDGEVGSKVNLTIVRGIKVLDIPLTRKEYTVHALKTFKLPNEIGLIELKRVTHDISKEMKEAIAGLEKDGYGKKIIFDLRGNGGGVASEGVDLADLFLKSNELVMMIRTKSEKIDRVVSKDADELAGKYAVLTNKQTASSSEVLVATLKNYRKARVFGTPTYGKGIIDRSFDLPNKFRVLFPTGVMYSPKGVSWQLRGVTPDVTINQDLKLYSELAKVEPTKRLVKDEPLRAAVEYLKGL